MDNQPTNPTPTPEPTPVDAPVVEPTVEPVAEPATETVAEPEAPAVETPAEPAVEPVTEPVTEASAEVTTEPVAEPAAEPAIEPVAEIAPVEPVVEAAPAESVAEPAAPVNAAPFVTPEPVAEPVAPVATVPAKKNNTTLILAIVLGVLVLVGAGVGIYFALTNKGTNPATPTTAPEPAVVIKEVDCIAKGQAWSYEQSYTVDETAKQVTEQKVVLKADATKVTPSTDPSASLLEGDANVDPETAGIAMVSLASLAFQGSDGKEGITLVDKSTEAAIDLTYKAVREEITDEDELAKFEEVDGLTAAEMKAKMEEGSTDTFTLTCTIK